MRMKHFWAVFALLPVLLQACGTKDDPVGGGLSASVSGVWELSSVATKATVGSVEVSVYLDFSPGGGFVLYQKIGAGRYRRFTGSYALSKDGALGGNYDSGGSWGPYAVSVNESTLVLSTDSETDTYKKIGAVPGTVLSQLYD